MDGKPYRSPAKVRRVGETIPWPDPKRDPRFWWEAPEAWTPWNWLEATDQWQTIRKTKSQI